MPLYIDMYYNHLRLRYDEQYVNDSEFKMQEFMSFADWQSEGAAPFKQVDSTDFKYLHMRTKALETWNKFVHLKELKREEAK